MCAELPPPHSRPTSTPMQYAHPLQDRRTLSPLVHRIQALTRPPPDNQTLFSGTRTGGHIMRANLRRAQVASVWARWADLTAAAHTFHALSALTCSGVEETA